MWNAGGERFAAIHPTATIITELQTPKGTQSRGDALERYRSYSSHHEEWKTKHSLGLPASYPRGGGDRDGSPHIGLRFANDRCLWSEHPSGASRMTLSWYMITLMLKWLPLITETSIPHHVSCGIEGFNAIFPCTPPQCVFATMRPLQKATVCRWIMAQARWFESIGQDYGLYEGGSLYCSSSLTAIGFAMKHSTPVA